MSSAETTPRPWHTVPWKHSIISLVGSDDTVLGDLASTHSAADAELIVRAVNAHDELVSACEEELTIYDGMDKTTLRPETIARIERLRAALVKAGEL